MKKTTFEIHKMDCPSEESLIRMKLENGFQIHHLEFDLKNRTLFVFHQGPIHPIDEALRELNLGSKKIVTEESENTVFDEEQSQRKLLWSVLFINFTFFILELSTGIFSKSMGLVADSLDMLADSFVYAISLFAVGGSIVRKKKIAKTAGYFQIILAIVGFAEVVRRFISNDDIPDFKTMIYISILALIANGLCLYLLQKAKNKEDAHIQASMIFTSNDVIINLGVILAAILVNVLNSSAPDLIIGSIVFILDIQGARRILKLS